MISLFETLMIPIDVDIVYAFCNSNMVILDCIAPYTLDIFFDNTSNDKAADAASNTLTSCGK